MAVSEQQSPGSHQAWLEARNPEWQHIEQSLPALADDKPIQPREIELAMRRYPELARDLAIARRTAAGSKLTAYLEYLYQNLYRALYRQPRLTRDDVRYFAQSEVPAAVYLLRWHIFSVAVGFVLAAAAGWWLVSSYPELAALFASEEMINGVQNGELWTDGLLNIIPSSILSVQIFTNNIMVALTALSLGVLYGIGTIYIIGLNGLMLGGVFAFVAAYGMDDNLLNFIAAHGPVELSVIVIAGAIGFYAGESLARPGQRSRGQAFQAAVKLGSKLMLVCVIFLIGAGLIEGYISPDPAFGFTTRVTVGLLYWVIFIYTLMGFRLHWRHGSGRQHSQR